MLKKGSKGAAVLETVIVLPLLLLLIFLVIEFQSLGQARHAVSTLAGLMAQDFSISGSAASFENNILKFQHILDKNSLSYYVHLYSNLDDITPHEPYFDSNGNGVFDGGEAFADMNFDKSHTFNQLDHNIIFVGKQTRNVNFFSRNPELRAGMVVVLYKFRFIFGLIQKIFSSVALIGAANDLPIIGTGIIVRY